MSWSEPMSGELLAIPEDAICPISQQIMEDPVVCADGHSYERSFIQRWLALGKRTSPRTNLSLAHTTLIPNLNLRGMIQAIRARMPAIQGEQIRQLKDMQDLEAIVRSLMEDQAKLAIKCMAPGAAPSDILLESCALPSSEVLPENAAVEGGASSSDADPGGAGSGAAAGAPALWRPRVEVRTPDPAPSGPIPGLLEFLRHETPEVSQRALGLIEALVASDPVNRTAVWQQGGIPLIVGLLKGGSPDAVRSACALLCRMATAQPEAAMAVAWAGGIPPLVENLDHHSSAVRVEAVKTLWNLASGNADNQTTIAQLGAIRHLVNLLSAGAGAAEAREPALTLLTALASREKLNQDAIFRAGGIQVLTDLLKDPHLRWLASAALESCANEHEDNQVAIGTTSGAIPTLIQLLGDEVAGMRASAASTLLSLVSMGNTKNMAMIARGGGIKPLIEMLRDEDPGPREPAAGVLAHLANNVDNRVAIPKLGAIPLLIELLSDEEIPAARVHAALALGNLAVMNASNKETIAKQGGMTALVELLKDENPSARERAAAALSALSQLSDQNKALMVRAGAIPLLVGMLSHEQTRKQAVVLMRSLADDNDSHKHAIEQAAKSAGCDLKAAGMKLR
eukprot:TRINITY_DN57819_c0_g1_i1.p1 TRINITY_DN57819_c0_g1~~TRINITY_DN57819_c0_g1_i1.p1  ORF type:complete len:625 (-),score=117.30 TRINITY_DN57819_c0_g1_i1:49-1923(-)